MLAHPPICLVRILLRNSLVAIYLYCFSYCVTSWIKCFYSMVHVRPNDDIIGPPASIPLSLPIS